MSRNLTVVTRANGKQYILQGYVVGTWYLIPYVPHWNGGTSLEYWEPHYAKQDTWIPIKDVNWGEWNMTKEEYLNIKSDSEETDKEILAKFHASF